MVTRECGDKSWGKFTSTRKSQIYALHTSIRKSQVYALHTSIRKSQVYAFTEIPLFATLISDNSSEATYFVKIKEKGKIKQAAIPTY